MTDKAKRTEEYLSRGVYLPPTKQSNEVPSEEQFGLSRNNKLHKDFIEEDASLNINNLIKAARIEQSLNFDKSTNALQLEKFMQPDFCNEKRGFKKTLADGWGV